MTLFKAKVGRLISDVKKGAAVVYAVSAMSALLVGAEVLAQQKPTGFTCCNMRHDAPNDWINDINYTSGTRLIPVGSAASVTDYGRYRFFATIDGKKYRIGNDYSRDLNNEDFAKKYIVAEDPKLKIAKFPADIREAISQGKVKKGMTREQVIMSLGHPVTSENPDPKNSLLRYWLSSFDEFQIMFDSSDRIKEIIAPPATMSRVLHGG